MLVRARVAADGGDVDAPLVGEGAPPDVGHVLIRSEIGDLGDEVRQVIKFLELPLGETAQSKLKFQIGDDGREIGVAASFTVTVDRSLHVHRPGANGGQAIGDGALAVIVGVDP